MKLFALSIGAKRVNGIRDEVGMHIAMMILPDGASVEVATQEVAREVYPEREGWNGHHIVPLEIHQGFPFGTQQLTWELVDIGENHPSQKTDR